MTKHSSGKVRIWPATAPHLLPHRLSKSVQKLRDQKSKGLCMLKLVTVFSSRRVKHYRQTLKELCLVEMCEILCMMCRRVLKQLKCGMATRTRRDVRG